jgi:hypothetical protein
MPDGVLKYYQEECGAVESFVKDLAKLKGMFLECYNLKQSRALGLNPNNKNSQFRKFFCKSQKIVNPPFPSQKSKQLAWRCFGSASQLYI